MLKEWRAGKGWSQQRLATELEKMLGRKVGQSHVSAYERGVMPAWDVGEAIRKITGGKVKPENLF